MIPPNFRKLTQSQRREILKIHFHLEDEELEILSNKVDLSGLADVLVESSIGTFPIPLGIASGFFIDRQPQLIPMATEEPSVIAAASYGAHIIKAGGGLTTWSDTPIMTTQIYLKDVGRKCIEIIHSKENEIGTTVDQLIPRMVNRGGGYRGLSVEWIDETVILSIDIDVRDAMGANVINTVAEEMKNYLLALCGGRILMAILTNASSKRMAGASFEVPAKYFRKGNFCGEDICQKIVEANQVASSFPDRAVTHNKGIMNGISALAIATGNDTRAVESAAHYYAQKSGQYLPLTEYTFENNILVGKIALPLALGTIGGTTSFWPASRFALKILNNPDSQTLNQFAASLGLSQNLAALFALVTDGIQGGHMKLHAARIAYSAGARGELVRLVATTLWNEKKLDVDYAKEILENSPA